jgi:hypothetical protein
LIESDFKLPVGVCGWSGSKDVKIWQRSNLVTYMLWSRLAIETTAVEQQTGCTDQAEAQRFLHVLARIGMLGPSGDTCGYFLPDRGPSNSASPSG